MVLEPWILLSPEEDFKAGPWTGLITRCWDLKIIFWHLMFWEFRSTEMFKIVTVDWKVIPNELPIVLKSLLSHSGAIPMCNFASKAPSPLNFKQEDIKVQKHNQKHAWPVPGWALPSYHRAQQDAQDVWKNKLCIPSACPWICLCRAFERCQKASQESKSSCQGMVDESWPQAISAS